MWQHRLIRTVVLLTLLELSLAQYGTKGGRKPIQQTSTPVYLDDVQDFDNYASFEQQKPLSYETSSARPQPLRYAPQKISKPSYARRSYGTPKSLHSGVQYASSSSTPAPSVLSDNFKLAAKQAKKHASTPNKKIPVLAEIQPVDENEEETLPADLLFDQPGSYVSSTPRPYAPVKSGPKSYAPKRNYGSPLNAKPKLDSLHYASYASSTPAPLPFDEPQIEQQNEQQNEQQHDLNESPEEQLPESYSRPDYNKPGKRSLEQELEDQQAQSIENDYFDEQAPKKIVQQEHEIDHIVPVYNKPSYATTYAKPKLSSKPSQYGDVSKSGYGQASYASSSKPDYNAKKNDKAKPRFFNALKSKPAKSYAGGYGVKGKPQQHGTKGMSQLDVNQVGNGVAFKMMEFSMGQAAADARPKTYTPDYSPARAYGAPTGRAYDTVTTDPSPLVEEVPFEEDDFLRPLEPAPLQDEAEDELNNAELNVELLNPLTLEPVSAASRQSRALARKLKAVSAAMVAASTRRGPLYAAGASIGGRALKPKNAYAGSYLKARARAAAVARARAAAARAKAKAKAKARARAA